MSGNLSEGENSALSATAARERGAIQLVDFLSAGVACAENPAQISLLSSPRLEDINTRHQASIETFRSISLGVLVSDLRYVIRVQDAAPILKGMCFDQLGYLLVRDAFRRDALLENSDRIGLSRDALRNITNGYLDENLARLFERDYRKLRGIYEEMLQKFDTEVDREPVPRRTEISSEVEREVRRVLNEKLTELLKPLDLLSGRMKEVDRELRVSGIKTLFGPQHQQDSVLQDIKDIIKEIEGIKGAFFKAACPARDISELETPEALSSRVDNLNLNLLKIHDKMGQVEEQIINPHFGRLRLEEITRLLDEKRREIEARVETIAEKVGDLSRSEGSPTNQVTVSCVTDTSVPARVLSADEVEWQRVCLEELGITGGEAERLMHLPIESKIHIALKKVEAGEFTRQEFHLLFVDEPALFEKTDIEIERLVYRLSQTLRRASDIGVAASDYKSLGQLRAAMSNAYQEYEGTEDAETGMDSDAESQVLAKISDLFESIDDQKIVPQMMAVIMLHGFHYKGSGLRHAKVPLFISVIYDNVGKWAKRNGIEANKTELQEMVWDQLELLRKFGLVAAGPKKTDPQFRVNFEVSGMKDPVLAQIMRCVIAYHQRSEGALAQ